MKRLAGIAKEAHVPVVGVSETGPAGNIDESWMMAQWTAFDSALLSGEP